MITYKIHGIFSPFPLFYVWVHKASESRIVGSIFQVSFCVAGLLSMTDLCTAVSVVIKML